MNRNSSAGLCALTAAAALAPCLADDAPPVTPAAGMQLVTDPTGLLGIVNVNGTAGNNGPFFQSLGTNGRSCGTCHVAGQAFSFTPASARERFDQSGGLDPLFASVDGANCPSVQQGDRAGRSLLLQNGLIRIGIQLPTTMEFTISAVHDPYGCACTTPTGAPSPSGCAIVPGATPPTVSVYRRPLPSTNLGFLSSVMSDGRETIKALNDLDSFSANLQFDLAHQATDATLGHAQAAQPPTPSQLSQIVAFELGLFTAQQVDRQAGPLSVRGAQGGPSYLARVASQLYYPGINDSLGGDPSGKAFDAEAMTLFASWANLPAARGAIAAGEQLFNSAPLQITNVRGLNDNAALGNPASFVGHCTSCHDTPDVGNHSLPLPLDIGTSHTPRPGLESDPAIAAAVAQLSTPDLPVYLITGCPSPFAPGEPESFYTSDPGKALTTGKCSDFNRVKGPILRGLAARAPYFHNGAAADLNEVVNFYDQRFNMQLTDQQKSDLVAFLNSL